MFDLRFTTPVAASAILAADRMAVGTLLPTPSWEGLEFQNLLEAAILRSIGRLVANGATGLTLTGAMVAASFAGDGSLLTNVSASGGTPLPYRSAVNPTLDTFSWVNQSTASVAATANTIYLSDSDGYSGDQLRVRIRAAPATPYTVTMGFGFNPNYQQTEFNGGIVVRNAGSGKLISYGWRSLANGGIYTASYDYDSPTSYNATNLQGASDWPGAPFYYCRLTDNGTNRLFYTSVDGTHWALQFSEGRTTFLTADTLGFYFNNLGSGAGAGREGGVVLFDWAVT